MDNKLLRPIYAFCEKQKLSLNGVSLMESIALALSLSSMNDVSLDDVSKFSKHYASVQKLILTGTKRSNPIRQSFDIDKFVHNTLEIYSFIKSEQVVSRKPVFVAINRILERGANNGL